MQILVGILFGYFTTFFNWGASFLPTPDNILIRLLMMVVSTFCIALGLFFYVPSNLMPLAIEGTMATIAQVANHILRDFDNTFDIFIGADMEAKAARVMQRDGISREAAEKQIHKVEKERANHCAYFTHEQWGNAKQYDLMLRSNLLGIGGTVEIIASVLQQMRAAKGKD